MSCLTRFGAILLASCSVVRPPTRQEIERSRPVISDLRFELDELEANDGRLLASEGLHRAEKQLDEAVKLVRDGLIHAADDAATRGLEILAKANPRRESMPRPAVRGAVGARACGRGRCRRLVPDGPLGHRRVASGRDPARRARSTVRRSQAEARTRGPIRRPRTRPRPAVKRLCRGASPSNGPERAPPQPLRSRRASRRGCRPRSGARALPGRSCRGRT